jgi:hypothetical protein
MSLAESATILLGGGELDGILTSSVTDLLEARAPERGDLRGEDAH